MKIKVDENLPNRLVDVLRAIGHDTDTVQSEGLAGMPDPDIWGAVCRKDRFLITQDLDFSDTRRFKPGTHPGVRLRQPGANALLNSVRAIAQAHKLDEFARGFVALTENKLRIRRP
jgi:hypothetical protein